MCFLKVIPSIKLYGKKAPQEKITKEIRTQLTQRKQGKETTKVYMNDRGIIDMTKKLPNGHNIGGGNKKKKRKEHKQESNKN